MLLAEAIALATYEAGILVMLGGPVLLVWMRQRIDRPLVAVTALWTGVSMYFLFHLVLTLRDPSSYRAGLLAGSGLGANFQEILRSWLYSVTRAYVRTFGTSWYVALRELDWRGAHLYLAAGLTVFLIMPVVWLHARRDEEDKPVVDTRRYLVLAALAIVAVLAGMALYLPTGWRNSNWRVLLYSSIGAALAVTIGCFLVARLFCEWRRKVFLGVTSLLIGIATFHALAQHQSYFDYAQRQQNILAGIHRPSAPPRAWDQRVARLSHAPRGF